MEAESIVLLPRAKSKTIDTAFLLSHEANFTHAAHPSFRMLGEGRTSVPNPPCATLGTDDDIGLRVFCGDGAVSAKILFVRVRFVSVLALDMIAKRPVHDGRICSPFAFVPMSAWAGMK